MPSLLYKNILKIKFSNKSVLYRFYSTNNVPLKYTVPPLKQTLDKYTRYLQPIVSERELQKSKLLINEFIKPNGEGEILQKLLQEKADKTDNWLSEWWTDVAYLDGREPIVINSNPGIRLPIEKFTNTDSWINFCVNLLISVLKYKVVIDSGKLHQDYLNNEPLCMNQYYTLFNSCRIPGKRKDDIFTSRSHLQTKHERTNFVTVVHNNKFFRMDVIDPKTQMIYSKESLFRGFCRILDFSQTNGEPIGLMTSENRNVWGSSFLRLQEISNNKKSFSLLQQSILLFCLDNPVFNKASSNEDPNSLVARNALHGNGHSINSANRWFDKTFQIIVSSDGACGINYEHTPAEAPPLLSIVDYAYKNMSVVSDESSIFSTSGECPVEEMKFSLDKKSIEEIDASKNNINSLVNDLELHAVSFTDFGKTKIKSSKISPDAFIQIGLQLGYFNLHNCHGSTYESGSLRRFKLGRTDTIRSCSTEVVEFCKSVDNSSCSLSEQKRLLLTALECHKNYTKQVISGQGIDRHLLGLKLIAIENRRNIPDIFMDTSYSKAFHHILSTSQGPSSVDLTMCFGPLVPDGYGFCYNPMSDKINFCVSAINSSPSTNALSLSNSVTKAWKTIIGILQQ